MYSSFKLANSFKEVVCRAGSPLRGTVCCLSWAFKPLSCCKTLLKLICNATWTATHFVAVSASHCNAIFSLTCITFCHVLRLIPAKVILAWIVTSTITCWFSVMHWCSVNKQHFRLANSNGLQQ